MQELEARVLQRLFRDPGMFVSRDAWRSADFEVLKRSNPRAVMVGKHERAKDYLFKKYSDDVALDDQYANYARRVEGARRFRALIAEKQLRHILVPHKWLYELPREFSSKPSYVPSYVLVVDRLKILSNDKSRHAYKHIDEEVLRDLCVVLNTFRGLDFAVKNMPFTKGGQIAFIDTEHWEVGSARGPCPDRLSEYLSGERFSRATEIFEKLGP